MLVHTEWLRLSTASKIITKWPFILLWWVNFDSGCSQIQSQSVGSCTHFVWQVSATPLSLIQPQSQTLRVNEHVVSVPEGNRFFSLATAGRWFFPIWVFCSHGDLTICEMLLVWYWVKNLIFQRITRITWQLFRWFGSIRIKGSQGIHV